MFESFRKSFDATAIVVGSTLIAAVLVGLYMIGLIGVAIFGEPAIAANVTLWDYGYLGKGMFFVTLGVIIVASPVLVLAISWDMLRKATDALRRSTRSASSIRADRMTMQ